MNSPAASAQKENAFPAAETEHYFNKRKKVDGLLRTAFESFNIYDLHQQRVIFSQWRLMKKLGYEKEHFQRLTYNFFAAIRHPQDNEIIEDFFTR